MFAAAPAFADDPQAPAPAPAEQPAPAPAEQPAPEEPPKVDPAYGHKPDPAYQNTPGAMVDDSYGPRAGRDIYIKSYPDRSRNNVLGLSIAGGAGVLLGAVGLYFHLDSRDLSSQVNAQKFTGEAWTPEHQAAYDSANRSAVVAGVFYGIGGAVLLGTAIAYMVTEPKMETMVIRPHTSPKPTALVAPTRGGALIGGTWSF
jgi:hypothetical protein